MPYCITEAGQPAEGFVYVMECGGFYKIGWSERPRVRQIQLQAASPLPITIIGVVEGSKWVEADWHDAFKEKRVRGEWFALTEEDVSHILHDSFGVDRIPGDDEIA